MANDKETCRACTEKVLDLQVKVVKLKRRSENRLIVDRIEFHEYEMIPPTMDEVF